MDKQTIQIDIHRYPLDAILLRLDKYLALRKRELELKEKEMKFKYKIESYFSPTADASRRQ
jgi:hypothetical protein